MAVNTGKGSRVGSVKKRTQVKNPKTDSFTKRDEDPKSSKDGQFMDNKQGGKPFKGVAQEPDKRRKKSGWQTGFNNGIEPTFVSPECRHRGCSCRNEPSHN